MKKPDARYSQLFLPEYSIAEDDKLMLTGSEIGAGSVGLSGTYLKREFAL